MRLVCGFQESRRISTNLFPCAILYCFSECLWQGWYQRLPDLLWVSRDKIFTLVYSTRSAYVLYNKFTFSGLFVCCVGAFFRKKIVWREHVICDRGFQTKIQLQRNKKTSKMVFEIKEPTLISNTNNLLSCYREKKRFSIQIIVSK